ncbi:MAG: hypothetical protein JWM80_5938 [Cyanobacteria bacterium RYN_339]|nr:hypothetical protein [Cyanobacteria bacterium RYN_339]
MTMIGGARAEELVQGFLKKWVKPEASVIPPGPMLDRYVREIRRGAWTDGAKLAEMVKQAQAQTFPGDFAGLAGTMKVYLAGRDAAAKLPWWQKLWHPDPIRRATNDVLDYAAYGMDKLAKDGTAGTLGLAKLAAVLGDRDGARTAIEKALLKLDLEAAGARAAGRPVPTRARLFDVMVTARAIKVKPSPFALATLDPPAPVLP